MLNVKFIKADTAVYISHIDMQRVINRTIKRAGILPRYSGGYNPHTLLKMSSPIPLGVESRAEYFTLETDGQFALDDIIDRLNAASPLGIRYQKVWDTAKSPNFAGKIAASDYFIKTDKAFSVREQIFLNAKESFIVMHKTDGVFSEKEAKDLIFGLKIDENGIFARLASGNVTLRIDRFFEALNRFYDLQITPSDIVKTAAYYVSDGNFTNADDYLDILSEEKTLPGGGV